MKKRDPSLLLFIACCIRSTVCFLPPRGGENGVPAGISIAFPQRDLHLNTLAPLQVSIVESSKE